MGEDRAETYLRLAAEAELRSVLRGWPTRGEVARSVERVLWAGRSRWW